MHAAWGSLQGATHLAKLVERVPFDTSFAPSWVSVIIAFCTCVDLLQGIPLRILENALIMLPALQAIQE